MSFFRNTSQKPFDIYQLDSDGNFIKSEPLYTYWWDEVPNFGDWIGPYIISRMTNRPLVNCKGSIREKTLFSVGSILEHIDRDYNMSEVWGSGLIQPLHKKRAKKLNKHIGKIYAVRGELTRSELIKHTSLEVPKIFGDPALLMPHFYMPLKNNNTKKISICPHFSHYKYFSNVLLSDELNVIDVRNSLKSVLNDIINSKICISSSLHGLIIAQAYGIPWVWLDLPESALDGNDFKFYDFFSTLKRPEKIQKNSLSFKDINEGRLIELAQKAHLNELKYGVNSLYEEFPY